MLSFYMVFVNPGVAALPNFWPHLQIRAEVQDTRTTTSRRSTVPGECPTWWGMM